MAQQPRCGARHPDRSIGSNMTDLIDLLAGDAGWAAGEANRFAVDPASGLPMVQG
jgi:hypothetical protein